MRVELILLFIAVTTLNSFAQPLQITGRTVDALTDIPIEGVSITIENTFNNTISDTEGYFLLELENLETSDIIILFSHPDHLNFRLPVKVSLEKKYDLGFIPLQQDQIKQQLQLSNISLSENELDDESRSADNIAGLLLSSKDVFLNAAAFDFNSTFFRPRGIDSEYSKLLINSVEMNKLTNRRPQWANWGGLNDLQRNQVFSMGALPGDYSFGGLSGTTNIIMRASQHPKGGRVSYASANRTYNKRFMASYSSGELSGGWWYSILFSHRSAREGYVEGTVYNANSIYLAIEKRLSKDHHINLTSFYTPSSRGKSAPFTQEVFDLKGVRYNPYWGFQGNDIRNSRMREIEEPVFMLNHFWKISEKLHLNNNISYQFGRVSNSYIDYGGTRKVEGPSGDVSYIGGGSNPDPGYYQKLPSYYLRFDDNPNYEAAFRAQKDLIENWQLNWDALYQANLQAVNNDGNSIYALSEDRNDDRTLSVNSLLSAEIKDWFKLYGKIRYTHFSSDNYAAIKDLLGGNQFLDIDLFAKDADRAQSDLKNRDQLVLEGDAYKYSYNINAKEAEAYLKAQFIYKRFEFYTALNSSYTNYQRNGHFQNANYPNTSFGKSDLLEFDNYGFKTGLVFKHSGKHILSGNAGYFSLPPNIRNSFANPRVNNETVVGIESEKIFTTDASYIFRSPKFRSRLTGYYSTIKDATQITFYYTNGLSGLGRENNTAFVQEILKDVDKQYYGVELGMESQITSTLKLKAVAALGQYTYSNNPSLEISSANFSENINYGTSFLKNYRIPGGPQRAAQLGFEYRDPDYWWIGATLNYFSHAFTGISAINRTQNFSIDSDGLPLLEYDPNIARALLKQEQLDDYSLVNIIGGKSWRVKSYYLGFFISINNVLDKIYKTGGFEQSRNSNYRTLKTDRDREYPLFGNKYWWGNGATYYSNFYIRF